ncbi:MAG: hypothetical protein Q7V10_08460 [Methanobacteriaceae archaeon]|nr:hypothetical protein [Methanobacteriaceae archaeon]MDO9627078.1 hypothetical protein [Methanobacteriaceae archaeon]
MIETVKKYKGKGTFDFILSKRIKIELDFNLLQYSNANIIIEAYLNHPSPEIADLFNEFQEKIIKVDIDGNIHDPEGKIKIEKSYLNSIKIDYKKDKHLKFKFVLKIFEPIEIIFGETKSDEITISSGLTNFIFRGCNNVVNPFDSFKAKIDEFEIFFIHNENYGEKIESLKENKKKILVTSEATTTLHKNKEKNFPNMIKILTDLLSYSCRNRISPIYEDYYANKKLFKTILRPVFTQEFNKEKDIIDSNNLDDCDLRNYLEVCYPKYLEYINKFGLNIFISFYLEAFSQKYSDLSFLLFVTGLETILTGYEEICVEEENSLSNSILKQNINKIKRVLENKGLEEYEEIADEIADKISYPHPTMDDKLTAFSKDTRFSIKLTKFDRDFIQIRNKIAHTGKFPKIINSSGNERNIEINNELNRLIYLLDRIILTILGYKGEPFLNIFESKKEILD